MATTTSTLIVRGLGYAVTSALALASGHWIQLGVVADPTLSLLCILWVLSIPFFICYAICFHYGGSSDASNRPVEADAAFISAVLAGTISLVIWFAYAYYTQSDPPRAYLLLFAAYAALFNGYATLLFRNYRPGHVPIIRHQLVWPVVLTIAVSLYVGRFFGEFSRTYRPFWPIFVLVLYFVATELFRLPKKPFAIVSILGFMGALIFIMIWLLDRLAIQGSGAQYFSIMVFCLTLAGYLAVFEAWRVTAHQARRASVALVDGAGSAQEPLDSSPLYFFSSFAALAMSAVAMPLAYVFSHYGLIFIVGFTIHAIVAALTWSFVGFRMKDLLKRNWVLLKGVFGFTFLALLVVDSRFNIQPMGRTLARFVDLDGLALLAIAMGVGATRLITEITRTGDGQTSLIKRLPVRRMTVVRLASILAFAACTLLLIVQDTGSQITAFKVDQAFLALSLFIIIGLFAEIADKLRSSQPPSVATVMLSSLVMTRVIGLLQATRVATSTIIGLAVFLPAVSRGATVTEGASAGVPFVLAAMGGFLLNDYFDAEKDRVNKPNRAIPAGRISPRTALRAAALILTVACVVSTQAASTSQSLSLYGVAIVGVVAYNVVVHWLGLTKGVFSAFLCGLPILYDVLNFGYPSHFLFLPVVVVLFISGRELLMDVRDIPGDRKGRITTIPMVLGEIWSARLAFALQLAAGALLAALVRSGELSDLIVLTLVIGTTVCSTITWWTPWIVSRRVIILFSWVPLISGLWLLR